MTLPTDAEARKRVPIATGFLNYFPLAIVAVAELSRIGNDQHNPGSPIHWDRSKSRDEADALMRHFMERGTFDNDGVRHSTKMAWRAMALLQKELEEAKKLVDPIECGLTLDLVDAKWYCAECGHHSVEPTDCRKHWPLTTK